jgi:signal transduction histidine kinase/CheY-like chemotaxis protein
MGQALSVFNWSLKKLLVSEPDTFQQAKIKILYTILIFSIAKLLIVLPLAWQHQQNFQLGRAIILLAFYLVLFKLLLSNRKIVTIGGHLMIWTALLIIWSNVFVAIQAINMVTLQFVYMVIMSSFYLLDKRLGIIYSFLSTLPIIIYLLGGQGILQINQASGQIGSPAYQIIVVLNFVGVVTVHYLFQQAFSGNITEKEALNKQLQIAVAEANLAAQSKSDFLSTMSHELRTPLSSVIGMAEMLIDDPHDEEQLATLKILNFSALRLHSLINDILDFNKLGSNKLHLEEISVNLYELVNATCSGLQLQAQEKGLNMVLEMDEALSNRYVLTDPTRITQIVYNLSGNAIKFTASGQVSVQLKVIDETEENLHVRFSIADTGIGITTEQQKIIFEPFTQASTSITRNFGGTGLGLAIVKRLLLLFDSHIEIESIEGVGSVFSFDLCLKIDRQPVTIQLISAETNYDLSKLRVLVAEDNSMNRFLLKKVFSRWNNIPAFAENGEEVVEQLSLQAYDVVLMDIHMPIMDGYQASRAIRQLSNPERSGIPIIALTASVSNNLGNKIKEAGMNDYIFKPFNTKELYGKLKNIELNTSYLIDPII